MDGDVLAVIPFLTQFSDAINMNTMNSLREKLSILVQTKEVSPDLGEHLGGEDSQDKREREK
jgi:hypothetical protein